MIKYNNAILDQTWGRHHHSWLADYDTNYWIQPATLVNAYDGHKTTLVIIMLVSPI